MSGRVFSRFFQHFLYIFLKIANSPSKYLQKFSNNCNQVLIAGVRLFSKEFFHVIYLFKVSNIQFFKKSKFCLISAKILSQGKL